MKTLPFIIALLCSVSHAQKNSITLASIANLNGHNSVTLADNTPDTFSISSYNRSSGGGELEYDRNTFKYFSFGAYLAMNKTAGVLRSGFRLYQWPLMRYEMVPIVTEKIPLQAFNLDLSQGYGFVLTQSLVTNSGWSHDKAIVTSFALEEKLGKELSIVSGDRFINSHQGCYDGRNCSASWNVTQEPFLGLKISW